MNRSYSKLRHIQESNMRLERRLINEQVSGETLDQILSTSPKVSFLKSSVRKYKDLEVVTWDKFNNGKIQNSFFKNCNRGGFTNTNKVDASQSEQLFSIRLCQAFFPNLQVALNAREYTAKQAQYIKDNPSQTGDPTP